MSEQREVLSSWKEISAYLKRTPRTCQRFENEMGLPVHRLDGSAKARVFAYSDELDAWLAQKVDEHEQAPRKSRRLAILGLAGAGAVAAVAAILILALKAGPAAGSIAVLPFDDLSPGPGSEELAAGLTEDITDGLGRIHGLRVTGRVTASVVKKMGLDARRTGRALKVRYLIEGSTRVAGPRLRAVARLVEARNGFVLWAEDFDRPKEDFFAVKDGIASSVAARLGIVLSAREESALRERPTADMQAYELYMTGRYLLGRPKPEAPGLALRYFEEALRRDPKFALAKVGIAWFHINMATLLLARPNDMGPKAEAAAREALALGPDLAEAHAVNAWVQFIYGWNWDAAEADFQRALELDPADGMTRGWYAYFLFSRRRFKEARKEIGRALAAEPLTPYLHGLSMWIHVHTGGTEEALKEFRKVQAIEPDFSFAYFGAGLATLIEGRIDESIEMFKKSCLLPGTRGWPEAGLAVAYLKKGDRKSAADVYGNLLREWEKTGLVSAVHVAWAAAAMGDIDRALELLRTAVRERDPSVVVVHVATETSLPRLARDPRFLAVLDEVGLPR
ncbi:MAG TPA: tetratricopeptide repeat protein [Candidatus Aminicenantes bacterium]|nr:tetratricopeptide repeat protein [Candidatus Aminicenantes bacterium]HRY66128.1 tetratricopeptide repeat protein [Candidatus Aminicenantes bacterium]HRZ73042.1 tetratricopeptide repeat protein [Candidatus Aminicenantes bacterium]